jgi:hypothetical protein
MRLPRFLPVLLALAVVPAHRALLAQALEGRRVGFTAAAGIGAGSAGISCKPQCAADRQSGPTGLVRIGGSVGAQFVLGGEISVFANRVRTAAGEGTWTLSWFTLTGLWYPNLDEDYFVKIGAGIATVRAETPIATSENDRLDTSDIGLVVGIGQDIRLTHRFSVTPYLDYLYSSRSNAVLNRTDSGVQLSGDVIYVGLAVTLP